MKKIYITLCIISFAVLFATAAQADAGLLAIREILNRCGQAFLLMGWSVSGLYRWEARAEELRRREARRADMRAAYYAPIEIDVPQPHPAALRALPASAQQVQRSAA
ncbi:MAG: hypothetical protein IJ452_07970 [Butyricicoccus sp.]|nr:hypothetical protein [Butyricicoccus sp.]MBQ8586201.1 hypothetical protein [Butyricicoccus sp.]